MRKFKVAIKTAAFLLAVLLPFLLVAAFVRQIPPQYGKTFLAELAPKVERLKETSSPKLVVIGGSNLAFGLDSKKMEEYLDRPCVNFGLYATLGTKVMLDLSRSALRRGDVAVICPETDPQTYSLFFDGQSMCQALESKPSLFFSLRSQEKLKVLAAVPAHLAAVGSFLIHGTTPDPEGVYRRDSFDAYGDVVYPRPYNDMPSMRDESKDVRLDPALVTDEFTDYLNAYAGAMARKGVRVYFSFPPMNEAALADGTDDESIYAFYTALSSALDFEIISDPRDYILDRAYFYDTNYHLNEVGAQYRTSLLARDVRRALGDTAPLLDLSFPLPPERPIDYFGYNEDDDTTGFFLYTEQDGAMVLTGLTESGKKQTLLTMPVSFEGKPVTAIAKEAFAESEVLERVFIDERTNLTAFFDGAFDGCPTLTRVEIMVPPARINAGMNLFGASNTDCKIFVPLSLYARYATDYGWGPLVSRIDVM